MLLLIFFFFFSSRRRHTRLTCDWSSDVCSSDLRWRPPDRCRCECGCRAWSGPPSSRRSPPRGSCWAGCPRWCRTGRSRSEERSCRERGEISGGAGLLKKKKEKKRGEVKEREKRG